MSCTFLPGASFADVNNPNPTRFARISLVVSILLVVIMACGGPGSIWHLLEI